MRRPAPTLRPTALFVVALAALVACKGEGSAPPDAGTADAAVASDARAPDAAPAAATIDFTVIGCPHLDGTKPECRGAAPLTITFVPITSGEVSTFLWDFGDHTTASERTPSHTYTLPGAYDVTVIGKPGLAVQTHEGFTLVVGNPLGDPCDVDSQCGTMLSCFCGSAAKCPAAFARGFCTQSCGGGATCREGTVCADLTAGADPTALEAWRGRICLRGCTDDRTCSPGDKCRWLPGPGADLWVRGCFPRYPYDVGGVCRAANGQLQHGACLTGTCADLGALGSCSLDCSARVCPAGSSCAAFKDGRRLCVLPCSPEVACQDDPLMACTAPGSTGPLAFTVTGAAADARFCGPRPCAADADADCAPAGTCSLEAGSTAGHCVRKVATVMKAAARR